MTDGKDYTNSLLPNIHKYIGLPDAEVEAQFVKGDYFYYHYGCDGFDDRGWGCGYRTLMTLCSWIRGQLNQHKEIVTTLPPVPRTNHIQRSLADIGDKPKEFIGSRDWIGCVEASMIIDTLYNVSSKIIHVNSGNEIYSHADTLYHHFKTIGSPIMMGGDIDNSSKGIVGIAKKEDRTHLLIVDPHYWGKADVNILIAKRWIQWRDISTFDNNSFYNICLPQLIANK